MSTASRRGGSYLTVCLNPVIQKTLVFPRITRSGVNRTAEYRIDAAGKGVCCSRVLIQSGQETVHLTQLGGPTRGWFLELCETDDLDVHWVESYSPIRFCTTIIESGDACATELVEEALPVDPGTGDRILDEYRSLLSACSTVMISGTKAPGFPEGIFAEMSARATEAGKRVFLDIKGADLLGSLASRPIVAKPNMEELLQTYATEFASEYHNNMDEKTLRSFVASIGADYRDNYGTWLIVTRGSMPTLYWDGTELRECPTRQIKTRNPIGSGDSFTVGVAMALEDGATIAEAVEEGTRLGALNAERLQPGSII